VNYISGNEGNLVVALKNKSERLTQQVHLSLAKSDRFAIDKFLLSNSVCWVTPYRASQSASSHSALSARHSVRPMSPARAYRVRTNPVRIIPILPGSLNLRK